MILTITWSYDSTTISQVLSNLNDYDDASLGIIVSNQNINYMMNSNYYNSKSSMQMLSPTNKDLVLQKLAFLGVT